MQAGCVANHSHDAPHDQRIDDVQNDANQMEVSRIEAVREPVVQNIGENQQRPWPGEDDVPVLQPDGALPFEIGRASCRERV